MALRSLLRKGELLCVPGVYDGMTVRLAEKTKAPALYMTGYGTVASHLGLPDAGLASYGEMVERVRVLSGLASVPLIADGDTGYGGLLNCAHAVRGYEAAGAAAIQIEDQEFPKKCGHTPQRRVVPRDQAAAKIKVAVDARRNAEDFLIIARTDARTNYGLDEALRRGEAFAEAGADVLFIEAPESEAEMAQIGKTFGDIPLLVNVVEGGKTPVLPRDRYVELGYSVAIFPATAFLAAAKSIELVYSEINRTGATTGVLDHLADFMAFSKTMGFQDVWDFEKKYAHLEQRAADGSSSSSS